MKRIVFLISLSFFAFSVNSFGQKIDFKVKGIDVGESQQMVLSKLGNPLTSKNDGTNPCGGTKKILTYSGLRIIFDEGEDNRSIVKSIEVTSPKWEMAQGLKIGSNLQKVQSIYGQSIKITKESDYDIATYYDGDGTVNFYLRDGKLFKAIRDLNLC